MHQALTFFWHCLFSSYPTSLFLALNSLFLWQLRKSKPLFLGAYMCIWKCTGRRQHRPTAEKRKSLSRKDLRTDAVYRLFCLHSGGKRWFSTSIKSSFANSLERLTYLLFTSGKVCTDCKEMYLMYVIIEIQQ